MLASKIRISVWSKKSGMFCKKDASFYMKYASVVLKALRKPMFQKFLKWMLRRENIEENMVKDVQVRVFPFLKENGNGLAGKFNSKGKILIYPKKLEFFRKLTRKYGKRKTHSYIKSRARAALIHECLHVKYSSDEEKVRELTRKYFKIFTRHRNTQYSNAHNISKMLFKE